MCPVLWQIELISRRGSAECRSEFSQQTGYTVKIMCSNCGSQAASAPLTEPQIWCRSRGTKSNLTLLSSFCDPKLGMLDSLHSSLRRSQCDPTQGRRGQATCHYVNCIRLFKVDCLVRSCANPSLHASAGASLAHVLVTNTVTTSIAHRTKLSVAACMYFPEVTP